MLPSRGHNSSAMRRSVGVSITALPVEGDDEELFLVSFVDDPTPELSPVRPVESAADASRVAQLEQELEATREDLQSAIRDLEMANEEQKAINEEAMSVNEEFQSTNEELETSKEELQSLNEELTALNSQLHETVEQQRATSNDLQNILNSTDVATLFLDADLNIRFFTPAAKSLFNVIASDVGRPLADLTRRFEDDDLLPDARAVLASHVPDQARGQRPTTAAGSCEGCCLIGARTAKSRGWSSRLPAFPRSRPPNAKLRPPAPISTASSPPFASRWSSSMRSCASSRRRAHSIASFRSSPRTSSGDTSWLQAIISMCPRFANSWPRSRPEAPPSTIMRSRSNCRAWDGGHSR